MSDPKIGSAAPLHKVRRVLIIILIVFVYIVGNYALAWFDAYRLGNSMLADADAALELGEYLDALMGYEERDPETGLAIPKGGYSKVVRLWEDEYAWPQPQVMINKAKSRVDEIITEKLTISDAEAFIQANIGIYNPYFGDIFLRLGELYEEDGDVDVAIYIYQDAVELLTDRPDIIEKAEKHLERLENEL